LPCPHFSRWGRALPRRLRCKLPARCNARCVRTIVCEPASVHQSPNRPGIMMAMGAAQEAGALLARLLHRAQCRQSRAHKIADCLMGHRVWSPSRNVGPRSSPEPFRHFSTVAPCAYRRTRPKLIQSRVANTQKRDIQVNANCGYRLTLTLPIPFLMRVPDARRLGGNCGNSTVD